MPTAVNVFAFDCCKWVSPLALLCYILPIELTNYSYKIAGKDTLAFLIIISDMLDISDFKHLLLQYRAFMWDYSQTGIHGILERVVRLRTLLSVSKMSKKIRVHSFCSIIWHGDVTALIRKATTTNMAFIDFNHNAVFLVVSVYIGELYLRKALSWEAKDCVRFRICGLLGTTVCLENGNPKFLIIPKRIPILE